MKLKWFSKNEIKILIVGIIGTITARGLILFVISHSVDDYGFVLNPNNAITAGVNQGRWTTGLILTIAKYLGILSNFSITLNFLFSIFSLTFLGLLICRMWKINNDIILSSIVILFFTTFPYQAEIYTFKSTSLMFISSLIIGFSSIYFSKLKTLTITLTAIGFCLSLSIYQIILNYIIPLLLMELIIEILRQFKFNNKINKKYLVNIIKQSKVLPQLLTVFLGVITYIITNKIVLSFLHITLTNRAELLRFSEYSIRMKQIKEILIKTFFINENIFPIFTKILLIIIFLLSIIGIIKLFINKKNHNNKAFFLFITIFILLTISIATNIGVLLVTKEWWPVPRVMIAFGIFWAGITTISYLFNEVKLKKIIIVTSTVIILSFIGINNHIYIDQIRINQKDANKANRIVSRLETNKNFNENINISIVGSQWSYGNQVLTILGDMNISAFGANWSQIPLLNEVSGYNFLSPSPEQYSEAVNYCNDKNPWPSEESVTIKKSNAIICLNDNI